MKKRNCEICGSCELDSVHRQHFIFPGLAQSIHYDVEACQACGFAFANNIPDQSELNQFYQTSSHHLHTQLPSGLQRIHANFFKFLNQYAALEKDARILDIGSGMGHFLHHFQNAGFQRLLGIEPSAAATELAHKTYGLNVHTATIDTFQTSKRFRLISLCGVLEHIADLKSSMKTIASLLEDDGYVFIAVPDTLSFEKKSPSEPFLEFALEHINFFSSTSLDNLLQNCGFEPMAVISQHNTFYDNNYLLALYRKTRCPSNTLRQDRETISSLRTYIDLSRQVLHPFEQKIVQLVQSQEPLLVWGVGSLTSRLLCDTSLGQTNIQTFIDRNPGLQGRKLQGVSIAAPESVMNYQGATVLIASTTYVTEIRQALLQKYNWQGRIVSIERAPL